MWEERNAIEAWKGKVEARTRGRKRVPSTFQRFSLFDNNGLTEGAIRRGLVRGRFNLLLKMAANVGDEKFRFTIFLSYRGRWKAESFTKVHRVSWPCYASFDENWKGAPQDPFLSWKTRSFLFIFLFFARVAETFGLKSTRMRWILKVREHRFVDSGT